MSLPPSLKTYRITPNLQKIKTDKDTAKILQESQKKAPAIAEHILNIRHAVKKNEYPVLQSIDELNDLLANVRDNTELQEYEEKLKILSRDIGQQKDAIVKRAFNNLLRDYRFAKRSMYVKDIEPELEAEPMSMTDYGYLTDYANNMIAQIQQKKIADENKTGFLNIIKPYRGTRMGLEGEIDRYMSITERNGVYKNLYSVNTKTKINSAIIFFEFCAHDMRKQDANVYQKKIMYLIDSYQSDPDWDDILRSEFSQRVASAMTNNFRGQRMFLINLDTDGNISANLFTKKLKDTQLGTQIEEFMSDPDDMFIVGYNRLYNILFELLGNLFLMAFVFQYWPTFTYVDRGCYWDEYGTVPEENAFAVYIGTGRLKTDNANVVNFHLDDIIDGTYDTSQPIKLFAPVTSASNDANVAFDFASGVIIKIYCINVKPYMCVSKSAREAETFILAGEYQYLKHYKLSHNGKNVTVFEFLQIDTDFNGIRPENLNQELFNEKKEALRQEIITSFPSFNPKMDGQMSPKRTTENIFSLGGSIGGLTKRRPNNGINKRKQSKKRNKRRRTNKRYNKRKI